VQNRGLYPGFAEAGTRLPDQPRIRTGLDHLSELGVTHVQLMPVLDFENDEVLRPYNWGYISTGFFSPEGSYATNPMDDSRVRELKALINALHARGIGVILDVVYNHTAESASLLFISNDYYFRHLPDGSLANGSACGNEIRSEAPMTRKLIIDSLKFWVTEYGVDGFRFDLMALIDQDTMLEADRELRAIRPDIVLYGEPWKAGPTPLAKMSDKDGLRDISPVGAFDDDFRNALKGFPDGNEPGWIQNGSNREALKKAMQLPDWFGSPEQSINYMTCHDNLVLWDKLQASMPGASGPLLKETMKLGYLALLTSQGVPFIHGGEEFARSKGGDFNSYVSSDSVNALDWSLKLKNFGLFNYVRAAIAMRKAHPVFRLRTRSEMLWRLKFEDTPGDRTIMFTLDSSGIPNESWKKVCVVLNSADTENASVTLPEGKWQVALDEHGVAGPLVSGNVNVRWKSGLVLYQN
ncbi:MAG: alpha-amylase family glycosyl hydrolase, partial [Chthoniobacterales bacterium]